MQEIAALIAPLRTKHPVCSVIPVNVLVFAEHDLKLVFDFKPISQFGQDAFLLRDFSGIVFDTDAFKLTGFRLNFSVAHELGHMFLHRDVYGAVDFANIEEWYDFFDKVPPEEYQKIEWQADEFAGQLLMPRDALSNALNETVDDAEREGYFSLGADAVLEFCCRAMHRDFDVSRQAMQTRLNRSKLWPHSKVPTTGA